MLFWQNENGKIQIFKFPGDKGICLNLPAPRPPSVASDDKRAIGWLCFLLLGDVMSEKSRRRVSNSSFPVCFLLGKLCREEGIEVRKAIQEVISTNRYFERATGIF